MAVARIGIPRRHSLVSNHFANSVGPSHGIVISEERKRPNLPRPMTFLTVLLQNRSYMTSVGDLSLFLGCLHTGNHAASHRCRRHADRAATENLFEGFGQIAARRLGTPDVNAELIVNATLIANHTLGIEYKDFRRTACAERVGHAIALVFQHGK